VGARTIAAAGAAHAGDAAAAEAGLRLVGRARLSALAPFAPNRATLKDLVLPPAETATLEALVAQMRVRRAMRLGTEDGRGEGIAALFWGESGTGKTRAAEAVAGELGLDLHRVDLARTVSKYIGETEKHLARLFDAAEASGAVLLFDEADALFGKRSEVKDSHDRYANIEVGYLLQRLETYAGLAILTTNLRHALDPAFARRLRFVVGFPFPDHAARARLWARAFPRGAEREELDPAVLARLAVPGGAIRAIATNASFAAAAEGAPVAMRHLLAAARAEAAKRERPIAQAELKGWE
jgi:SpoVK/Ycf46/Vps4 family AAA+-type ATPase